MDDRNGLIYPSELAAIAAGVPEKHRHPVEVTGDIVRVASGPFKGRCYDVLSDGRRGRRRRDLEAKTREGRTDARD